MPIRIHYNLYPYDFCACVIFVKTAKIYLLFVRAEHRIIGVTKLTKLFIIVLLKNFFTPDCGFPGNYICNVTFFPFIFTI